ncbi:protein MAINTENANCE OF MERISTEMS-like [Rhododendron vialii]|uniref:protein MAINTENANCE OF MERISTEMS-like n=1 Tax=Rhododendron vialii TaxID=182163 RepID=UPI00265D9459|nr:protein MAINTENANCE OF MERISTEMS-like [Rhododendron vialii]
MDEAGFREFIQTLTPVRNDHAVLVALADRWRDTTNNFHLPPGEMTVTPADFATIIGLRIGGEPIPFDSGIHEDPVALEWFLGEAPKIEEGMARRSKVHLSYLPALRDLRTASRFDWGGAALGAAYGFLGDSSRMEMSTAGLLDCIIVCTDDFLCLRTKQLWAYEVLNTCRLASKSLDLGILPRAHIWSKKNMGEKKVRGDLNGFRIYLNELRPSQIEWDPWRVARPEPEYLARSRVVMASRVLLESAFGWQWYLGDRVTHQSLGFTEFQAPGPLPPRASHRGRERLAGPLRVQEFKEVRSQAHGAAEERRAAGERQSGGEGRVPIEWANEVVRRMLALDNAAQRQVAPRRKSARDPPQKKLAARTPTPPVTTRR